jgi:hypothetical protein
MRKILALDQNDPVADFGDDVGRDRRAFRTWHTAILPPAMHPRIAAPLTTEAADHKVPVSLNPRTE